MHYVGGHSLRDLGSFIVLRSEGAQPFQPLVEIPVTDQERFAVQRTFSYLDGETRAGNTYRYEVVARTLDDYTSAPSNQVRVTWLPTHKQAEPPNSTVRDHPSAASSSPNNSPSN
jgi:hypothetical protein